jgi:rhamnulokinase
MDNNQFLAFDFGADSGRAVIGTLDNDKIDLREINRFPTRMLDVNGSLHWNILRFLEEMKKSLEICANDKSLQPASIGIDTWGVDFGLLSADGSLAGIPFGYRDSRTDGMMDEVFKVIPKEEVYKLTGIQFMQLNSLFQLFSMVKNNSPQLQVATDLLFMPDLMNYLLTGIKKNEFTISTTSQLFNPIAMNWEKEIFEKLNMPFGIMQEIGKPGTLLGPLSPSVQKETGIGDIPVALVTSHDTASAIAAIPAEGKNWAYISSGTWSLMGIETDRPLINEQTLQMDFTNEGGAENTFRFLKNIMGMWLLQECKRIWDKETTYTYPELVKMAETAPPFKAIINPDHQGFLNPSDMTIAITDYCKSTGQATPGNVAEFSRIIMESLALKYRQTLQQLQKVSPHPIEKIHIIGGGSQNQLLCQFTADATGLPVVAGPAEATATGNLLIQAKALGKINSLDEIRGIVRNSFECTTYEPKGNKAEWDDAFGRFFQDL